MKSETIAEAWESFKRHVIPPNAPDIQVREMRTGFYAGATFIFAKMTTGVSEGPEPQASDLAMLDALEAELREWQISMMPVADGKPS